MDRSGTAERAYAVPALEKGLDVIEALSAGTEPPTLAELARRLGRSSSELFRLLNCLRRRGYVTQEAGTARYRLSLRLYELAHTHSPVDQLLRAAEAPMRRLALELRESCHLSVLNGAHLVVLAQVESPDRIRFSVEVGARFPAVHTASGRLLLAHLPKGTLDDLLRGDPDFRALGGAERKRLLAGLLDLRRSGLSVAEGENFQGVRDVAAIVGSPRAGIAAALCVPALQVRGRWRAGDGLGRAVERAAREITQTLGLGGDNRVREA